MASRLSDEELYKIRETKNRAAALVAKQNKENANRMFTTFTMKEQIELLDECYIFSNKPIMINDMWKIEKIKKQHMLYVDGKLNGECTYWHVDGSLHRKVNFANNQLNGEFHAWYSDGVKAVECCYLNDKLHGTYRTWTRHNLTKDIICFENGKIIDSDNFQISISPFEYHESIESIEKEIHFINTVGVLFNIDMLFS